jgi:hypothetical protein
MAVSAFDRCLSTTSWSNSRVDLFTLNTDFSIGHKFWTGWDWQPSSGLESLIAEASSCPSASSWFEGRLDILYVNATGSNVLHKYFGGGSWGPSWEGAEDLGGEAEALTSNSWGENRLDIVVKAPNGSYLHKAWTGDSWFPQGSDWEDFGGNFFSNPALVSWGEGRLDIIGLSADNASLLHKYYQKDWSGWEDLGGGPFVGNPVATSWEEERLDFWAIDSNGQLNHLFWDGGKWSEWETLGGEFTDTPKVVHWTSDHIDIVGKGLSDDKYYLKSFDGSQWNPSIDGWNPLAGPFASEPALEAKHEESQSKHFWIP